MTSLPQSNEGLHRLDHKHYLPTFKRFPLAFQKGQGSRVWDVEGNEYIDTLAGIAVNNVGHAHPRVVAAIAEQSRSLLHISNFFVSPQQVALSEKLTGLSGLDRVFFSNSGAESVEGAIKIARKYAHSKGRGGTILSLEGSFHGRTLGAIATGRKNMQEGFEPIPAGFRQIPKNDIEAFREAISPEVAGIIIEPVQGEGGIHVMHPCYLRAVREICHQENIVLIFDEIQCGIGRTGRWFAKDHFGVQPDIMTLAKALGGGLPIGAILSNEKVSAAIDYGNHGTTFGGNPLVCAAALATLEVINDEQLLYAATEKGKWLKARLEQLRPAPTEVRGLGLMIGAAFPFETKALVADLLHEGVIANATASNVLRLVPALNISYEELDEVVDAIQNVLNRLTK
jgi:acetylornithine/N-succinyldiaminopimelate aminotransferase